MKKIFSKLYVKIILIIVLAGLLFGAGFYIVSWELAKIESQKILNDISEAVKLNEELKISRIENLELSKEKAKLSQEKTVNEIISFDEKIEEFKKEFNEKINLLPYKIETKYINIQELKKIAANGLAASADFKSELENIGIIPESFNDYYNLLIKYLDNNTSINNLYLAYFGSKNYSVFDDSEIRQLFKENVAIFKALEQERIKIFKENKIDSLIYKNLLLDPININKMIAGFFSPVINYLPKSRDFKSKKRVYE